MNIKLYLFIYYILFTGYCFAQAPQAFQYQAVARDNQGIPITNQSVALRISIISGSTTGAILYVETHGLTTNQFGLFTLQIGQGTVANGSFGSINWASNSHFMKIEMDETGGFAYQNMGTTQLISVPYALHANTVDNSDDADADPTNELQNLSINGNNLTISGGNTVALNSNSGGSLDAAYDFGGAGAGRTIVVDAGEVELTTNTVAGVALRTTNSNTGAGIVSTSTNATNGFSAIQANTNSTASGAAAIVGNTTGSAYGVAGQVAATASAASGIYGSNLRTNGGYGVLGIGFNGTVGQTGQSSGYGIYGENFDNIAPFSNGIGVAGKGYYGVLGEDKYLGVQAGAYGLYSNGNLGATGTKTFRIDHPKDPENKFLRHFSIESNEVLNVYRGTLQFDANGEAEVSLPDYFNDINRNVSYQLTPVGTYMPLYIKEKVNQNHRFVIGGGTAGKEVSWAVYAERNDRYLQQNPQQRTVDLPKRAHEKGKYLVPSLYEADPKKGIFYKDIPQHQAQKIRLTD